MSQKSAPFASINHATLPLAAFAAITVLLIPVAARSAVQDAAESRASAQEIFSGIVANASERNDTLTIQLRSDGATRDFKVQDGLIFNSVRYGDPVEITIETIDGARTITGLKKQ
jgi:Cu/Ag efflux protein CusF